MKEKFRSFVRPLAAAALVVAAALSFTAAPTASAQSSGGNVGSGDNRSLSLDPNTQAIQDYSPFLTTNGLEFAVPFAIVADATQTGSTTVFTIPAGYTPAVTFTGGLPNTPTPTTMTFYVTGVTVETTNAVTVTTGATFQVGNQTTANALLGSNTLSSSTATGGYQSYPVPAGTVLHTGDSIVFKITSGAVVTSGGACALKIHVRGFYH